MPLRFNALLAPAGIAPASVRLLRHQDSRSAKGRTPYELWRDERPSCGQVPHAADHAALENGDAIGPRRAVREGTPPDDGLWP